MRRSLTPPAAESAPRDEAELEERLSRPTTGVLQALEGVPGDVVVLGAGGKMGPSLARMVRRAADELGDGRSVVAVSRFSSAAAATTLEAAGVETIRAELTDRAAIDALPDAANVMFMAGQKFGTQDDPSLTWIANTVVPGMVADRYRAARVVAFSTGNVYALSPVERGGSGEEDALAPAGEYAWTCLGRERVLTHASRAHGTRLAIIRLNYAVDLRYGVLVDIAERIMAGDPVDLRMGYVNVIWQGDANAQAIQCLPHAAVPPFVVNVTGNQTVSVRELALELGRLLGREPRFKGTEARDALLSRTAKSQALFGPTAVSTGTLLGWVAEWTLRGGATLGKATHFEEREGRY